mgnify:CR=1 FL=1
MLITKEILFALTFKVTRFQEVLLRSSFIISLHITHESAAEIFYVFKAAFGGGMGVGTVCGAISGSLMVLGLLYSGKLEKETALKADITIPFLKKVKKKQGSLNCRYNKAHYAIREPVFDCSAVILSLAECLDETVASING